MEFAGAALSGERIAFEGIALAPIIARDRDIQSRRQAVQIFVFDLVVPPPAMMISESFHVRVRREKCQSTTRPYNSATPLQRYCIARLDVTSAT
jgi:hypothetical protein